MITIISNDVFELQDNNMGIFMPKGATLQTRAVDTFEGNGVYVMQSLDGPEARRVWEGVAAKR